MRFSTKVIKKEIEILDIKYMKYRRPDKNDLNAVLSKARELHDIAETESAHNRIDDFVSDVLRAVVESERAIRRICGEA